MKGIKKHKEYTRVQEGDYIYCKGLGYPHWKNEIFQVTRGLKIENDIPYIGIKNTVAVDVRDFCKVPPTIIWSCLNKWWSKRPNIFEPCEEHDFKPIK